MRTVPLFPVALALLVSTANASESFDPWSQPARYSIEYSADLSPLTEARSWRVWLPSRVKRMKLASSPEKPACWSLDHLLRES